MEKRNGFYFKDGQPYLSTTEILKVINKPALMHWFGKEIYYAMNHHPSLEDRTALTMPYSTSSDAKSRGTTVHSIVEAYKSTGDVLEGIPDQFQGYATAFYTFMRDHQVQLIEQEKQVFDPVERIAGTLDIYAKIGDSCMVIDVKTGKDIYPEAALQLSSYAFMLRLEGKPVDSISVLLLETGVDGMPTGKYKFVTQEEDRDSFLAAKQLYVWQNKEKLLKVGYLISEA